MNNTKEQNICLLCNIKVDYNDEFYRLSDNFIKIDATYFPFQEILRKVLNFDEVIFFFQSSSRTL